MVKEIWLNLPVKDVKRSMAFFTALGFECDIQGASADMASVKVGSKNFIVMLIRDEVLRGFMQHPLCDTNTSSELMISIDAESREDVDAFTAKVEPAGGKVFAQPAEIQGWMYGSAFTDPDGHRWNTLYMDMSKMPGK